MSEEIKQAARRLSDSAIAHGHKPEALHIYRDAKGEELFAKIRLRHQETGAKWMRPMHYDGGSYVLGEPEFRPGQKPIYALDLLAARPSETVFVVEGEKCADALVKRGLLATTSGSATSAPGADWSPLCNRHVTLWPDNDEPGQLYARVVSELLGKLGCTVLTIDVSALGLNPKGDCVDWIAAHPMATMADVLELPVVAPATATDNLQLVSAATIAPTSIEWIWNGWIPAGKLTLIAGAPGTGKTTAAIDFAAVKSCGGVWPDGTRATPGNVIFITTEDDCADTIVPRLMAAGANLERVYFHKHPVDADFGDETLLAEIEAKAISLIVADPIVSFMGDCDSHKNTETRRALQPLVETAARVGAAIIGITHFSKGSQGRSPGERFVGSVGFVAVARVCIVFASDADEPTRRIMVIAKSNVAPDSGGFEYTLDQVVIGAGISASKVRWGNVIHGTAVDLLSQAEGAEKAESKRATAANFLRAHLADGSRLGTELEELAAQLGISKTTLARAKTDIGAKSEKGLSMNAGWYWALPREIATTLSSEAPVEATHQRKVESFYSIGALRVSTAEDGQGSQLNTFDDADGEGPIEGHQLTEGHHPAMVTTFDAAGCDDEY